MSSTDEPPVGPSDEEVRDELPADLDATTAVRVTFPNNNRRRVPAVLYVLLGSGAVAATLAWEDETPLVNTGLAAAGIALVVFGLYSWVAGRTLRVDETEALLAAGGVVGFPVGHASAQLTWRGLLSRPAWRLLLYSPENPPARRAFVIVDGLTAEVLEWFEEANPEDWGGAG